MDYIIDGTGRQIPVNTLGVHLIGGLTSAGHRSVLKFDDSGRVTVQADVYPISGGNLSRQTNATGATYNAFANQECKQLTVINGSATAIEVQQDGTGVAIPIAAGSHFTFFGITNANQLGVRRVDTSNTQITVHARWES